MAVRGDVATVRLLSGRCVELAVGEGTLLEAMEAAGAGAPPGRTWAVVEGTETVMLETPVATLAGAELAAVLVPELLTWCALDYEYCFERAFSVCGLFRPGDEVVCLTTELRLRLPGRAIRLVKISKTCVHAVSAAGRSWCLRELHCTSNYTGYRCRALAAFDEAYQHGGPAEFASMDREALLLCADGQLLHGTLASPAAPAVLVPARGAGGTACFLQVAAWTAGLVALREDGEVLLWHDGASAVASSAVRGVSRLLMIRGAQLWLPSLVLAMAVDATGVLHSLESGLSYSPTVSWEATVNEAARVHGGCVDLIGSLNWRGFYVLAGDGTVHACSLESAAADSVRLGGVSPEIQAALERAVGRPPAQRRCARLASFVWGALCEGVLLLFDDEEAALLMLSPRVRVWRFLGRVEDLLQTPRGVLLRVRFDGADGAPKEASRLIWLRTAPNGPDQYLESMFWCPEVTVEEAAKDAER